MFDRVNVLEAQQPRVEKRLAELDGKVGSPGGCRSAAGGSACFQKRILRGKPWVFVKPQMAYTIYHIYIHKYINTYIYIFGFEIGVILLGLRINKLF